jgi:hypothetical protein
MNSIKTLRSSTFPLYLILGTKLLVCALGGYVAFRQHSYLAGLGSLYFFWLFISNVLPLIRGVAVWVSIEESQLTVKTAFGSTFTIAFSGVKEFRKTKEWIGLTLYRVQMISDVDPRTVAFPTFMEGVPHLIDFVRSRNPACSVDKRLLDLFKRDELN